MKKPTETKSELELLAKCFDRAGQDVTAYKVSARFGVTPKTARKWLESWVERGWLNQVVVYHRPNVNKVFYKWSSAGQAYARFMLGYSTMNEFFEDMPF